MKRVEEPKWLFPFEGMSVGDSFFIPTLTPSHMVYVVDTRAKASGIRVKVFPSMTDGCLGVRVWRIA